MNTNLNQYAKKGLESETSANDNKPNKSPLINFLVQAYRVKKKQLKGIHQ